MKIETIRQTLKNKSLKKEFVILTNLINGESEIFFPGDNLSGKFSKYSEEIEKIFHLNKNGVIENSEIFVQTYKNPIKVIVVGAVDISMYLIDFAKNLNFEIIIVDPRGYFASKDRFPDTKIINKWPNEAFDEIETNSKTALVTLTHDPKIDDPALQYALKNKFFYIGALGSKKTHEKRCSRLIEVGFKKVELEKINGPIGIKLGGKSPSEIALSIISQLVSEKYKN
ncbi:XdhC family protein [Candidatus Pelagibacter sp. HIMB123]|uniref:XdhC family protein n=1 Tax=Candidatus Pelagibacter sp. HIMB123 TaxID=3415413 RepID=UPI003F843F33